VYSDVMCMVVGKCPSLCLVNLILGHAGNRMDTSIETFSSAISGVFPVTTNHTFFLNLFMCVGVYVYGCTYLSLIIL